MSEPVPGPPSLPLLGNLMDVDPNFSLKSLLDLAEKYGPIYKLNLGGDDRIFISSHELVDQVCSQSIFTKMPVGSIAQLRPVVRDAMFTAYTSEENWSIAHRTLVPAFGLFPIQDMFDGECITLPLVLKWARYGPTNSINVTSDFTRLTLDTIGLTAMGTRFNSFYKDELHPFVKAFGNLLTEASLRSNRPQWYSQLMWTANRKFEENAAFVKKVAGEVIADRRANPTDKKDLLNSMLRGKDPLTGNKLTDECIENNMITFLFAGMVPFALCVTTSGLLSFLFAYLIEDKEVYANLQREVDTVLGRGPITVDHIRELKYTKACIRETLRLQPTGPVIALGAKDKNPSVPVSLGGKWSIRSDQTILILLPKLHRDPSVYGPDAEAFRPERMLEENFKKLPKHAWKPFGNGQRACIGNEFAMQEVILIVAMLIQNFEFSFVNPNYKLEIQQALTIKPKDLFIHARLRPGIDVSSLETIMFSKNGFNSIIDGSTPGKCSKASAAEPERHLFIFYGSNRGTTERLAHALAATASRYGFHGTARSLDEATGDIPRNGPVIFITASYEGEPPDNALKFFEWMSGLDGKALLGVKYAVFGCGNRDWADTFQKIPTLLDSLLAQHGAERFGTRGLADVAEGDTFEKFQEWVNSEVWPSISSHHVGTNGRQNGSSQLEIAVGSQTRARSFGSAGPNAKVRELKPLNASELRPKYHMDIGLADGVHYEVGDYIEILPFNHRNLVERMMKALALPADATFTIRTDGPVTLPIGTPVSAYEIFGAHVELDHPASIKVANRNAQPTLHQRGRRKKTGGDGPTEHGGLAGNQTTVCPATSRGISNPLYSHPAVVGHAPSGATAPVLHLVLSLGLPVWLYHHMVAHREPGRRRRRSALWPGVALSRDAEAGRYLHPICEAGAKRLSAAHQPDRHSLIMICAGSGLAPFRGFVQHRAEMLKREGTLKLAPALLFIGCRTTQDALYVSELEAWERLGVVRAYYAYSREEQKSSGCRYAQDRVWAHREEVYRLWENGGKVYVCGSHELNEGAVKVIKKICSPATAMVNGEAQDWWNRMKRERGFPSFWPSWCFRRISKSHESKY
ncbi:ABC transporter [Apiospora arundinis]